jgi:hypothetical protein
MFEILRPRCKVSTGFRPKLHCTISPSLIYIIGVVLDRVYPVARSYGGAVNVL